MKVKFVPSQIEIEVQSGQTVMDAAHKNGVAIRSTCNGMPSCAECRVRVIEGDWNCSPPSRKELSLIGTGYYIDQRRLSCQLLCFGDITVDTTEQLEKANEGPVTKKFLTKVHKSSAQESHSLGGVLIEQDEQLLQQLKNDVRDDVAPARQVSLDAPARPSRSNPRSASSGSPNGGSGGGGEGRSRRRRGGRNRR